MLNDFEPPIHLMYMDSTAIISWDFLRLTSPGPPTVARGSWKKMATRTLCCERPPPKPQGPVHQGPCVHYAWVPGYLPMFQPSPKQTFRYCSYVLLFHVPQCFNPSQTNELRRETIKKNTKKLKGSIGQGKKNRWLYHMINLLRSVAASWLLSHQSMIHLHSAWVLPLNSIVNFRELLCARRPPG